MSYSKNVFINCPFDEEYTPLLRCLIFTVIYLGKTPQLSTNNSSFDVRVQEIKTLIKDSKTSIHDLSRSKPMNNGDLPRFNMPFELGLDIGCIEYGPANTKNKKVLVLDTDRYYYQKVLSDIAGQDIRNHNDKPQELVTQVRNWFSNIFNNHRLQSASKIWVAYNQFLDDLYSNLTKEGFNKEEINKMPHKDFILFCRDWIREFKKK